MLKKLIKSSNGQSLVEFALVLPIFLLLVFGVVEFGRLGYSYVTLNNAVRSGARTASLSGLDSAIQASVADSAPLLDRNLLTIQITPIESSRHSGSNVTVSVSYPVSLTTPVLNHILPNPVVIHANLSMRIE
ncbi:MAG: pilus assembly protein [Dehalobacter sp. 4CP]|uniref:TadE/TadG family type IV pilus assembly protein n=1 Tax=Dehalobacter sp. CP TaxID=2594474 RepID=UPI0013C91F65|nr:pilus assembly protein [Dehalobacter sp. 4CP]